MNKFFLHFKISFQTSENLKIYKSQDFLHIYTFNFNFLKNKDITLYFFLHAK